MTSSITGIIPESLLKLMSPQDRAKLGQRGKTSDDYRKQAVAKDEKQIQKDISGYLRLLGIWHVQSRMDRRTSNTVGTPDFIFVYKGFAVFWECKTAWSSHLRPEQAEARAAIIRQGGHHRVITGLHEAQAHLRELDQQQQQ